MLLITDCPLQDDGNFDGNFKSPMEYIHDAPPIKVHGAVVASFGCEAYAQTFAFSAIPLSAWCLCYIRRTCR